MNQQQRTSRGGTRRRFTAAGLLIGGVAGGVCLVAVSCAAIGTGSPVAESGVAAVLLRFEGPTYSAATSRGLLLRSGEDEVTLPQASDGRWLPDGTALADASHRSINLQVLDPNQETLTETVEIPGFDRPGRSVTQINVLDRQARPAVLTAYSLNLEQLWRLRLPETDNPDATSYNELERNYYGVAPTIDGVTYVMWHDSSEWYEDGDYGVARVQNGDVTNVLLNERIVALYLSADGAALLALRQRQGEPCGGCVVEQEIVEIDPGTGAIAGQYGMPDDYTEGWRVEAIDKVDGRVAVRFTENDWGDEAGEAEIVEPVTIQRGTWMFDGAWSMIEGSDSEITWWQGEDRVIARPQPGEGRHRDGFALFWVHDGIQSTLPGDLERSFGNRYVTGEVAGQLLPPG